MKNEQYRLVTKLLLGVKKWKLRGVYKNHTMDTVNKIHVSRPASEDPKHPKKIKIVPLCGKIKAIVFWGYLKKGRLITWQYHARFDAELN